MQEVENVDTTYQTIEEMTYEDIGVEEMAFSGMKAAGICCLIAIFVLVMLKILRKA